MNIALSSLIIILLLLPAIFFRTFLIKSDSLENPLDTSIKTELGIIFLFAIFQHLSGFFVIEYLFNYKILPDQFYFILNGDSNLIDYEVFNFTFVKFLSYIFIQIILNIFIALVVKWFIIEYYLDLRTSFLPISNEWDNLLSGRIYEYDRIQKLNGKIKDLKSHSKFVCDNISKNSNLDKKQKRNMKIKFREESKNIIKDLKKMRRIPDYNFVDIDVLVNTAEGDMIYKGRVFKYYLAKDNTLDKIILKDAFRRKFINVKDNQNNNLEFYRFESKLFVIKYCEIKNLNARFTFYEVDNEPNQ